MPDARELQPGESHLAAVALLELRPHLKTTDAVTALIDEQRAEGYRVAASFEPGEPDAAAVAAFRTGRSLAWGSYLYVDDLITRASLRGRGHADAVMSWVEEEARRLDVDQLHLDSGVGLDRVDAHHFYFRHGLAIASYHFARRLR